MDAELIQNIVKAALEENAEKNRQKEAQLLKEAAEREHLLLNKIEKLQVKDGNTCSNANVNAEKPVTLSMVNLIILLLMDALCFIYFFVLNFIK